MNPDPTCKDVLEYLRAYLDGELPAAERGAFDAHLRACAACRAYLRTYEATIRAARESEEAPPPPEGLVDEVLRRVRGRGS